MSSLRDKLLALADTGTDQAWLRGFHRRAFAIECARLALEEAADRIEALEAVAEAGAKERETLAWLAKHATFDDMPADLYNVMNAALKEPR